MLAKAMMASALFLSHLIPEPFNRLVRQLQNDSVRSLSQLAYLTQLAHKITSNMQNKPNQTQFQPRRFSRLLLKLLRIRATMVKQVLTSLKSLHTNVKCTSPATRAEKMLVFCRKHCNIQCFSISLRLAFAKQSSLEVEKWPIPRISGTSFF